ncbi:MAG: DUF3604 domain-containing protein [Myxococcota bacterium]
MNPPRSRRPTAPRVAAATLVIASATGCSGFDDPSPTGELPREDCALSVPTRQALYGDLHAHTILSFDARSYDTVLRPADAYRFARGEAVMLPPLVDGVGTRAVQLDRPLDFAAITDHGELLAEVYRCNTPDSPGYESANCELYRRDVGSGALHFGFQVSADDPQRFPDVCGDGCRDTIADRWREMVDAAEDAYDKTSACAFTAFPAYEYTNSRSISNRHRNVVFAGRTVPEIPVSYYEAPTSYALWTQLREQCRDADDECDVIVIPHNANISNGNLFNQDRADELGIDRVAYGRLRAEMEPVAEIFQHKGDSECRNGFPSVDAEPDPFCDFEKLRPADDETCGDATGSGGMRGGGCSHRRDFLRNVLKEGLEEDASLGINPYVFGFIGSTDTHNGTPGYVASEGFEGHVGLADDTDEERLGEGNITHDGAINNPGGLAAVWAEENTRASIFAAFRRRETFATSGPRIRIRLFGGWSLPDDLCQREDAVTFAYEQAAPMGSQLPPRGAEAPVFYVSAEADAQSVPLDRLQIVKGWTAGGRSRERVFDLAVAGGARPTVDPTTCVANGAGAAALCAVWTDPDFDATEGAFYYARVLEGPTCRWSTQPCATFVGPDPTGCSDPRVALTVQQRAWSSPVWYRPD